jgi:hypothetical protein
MKWKGFINLCGELNREVYRCQNDAGSERCKEERREKEG